MRPACYILAAIALSLADHVFAECPPFEVPIGIRFQNDHSAPQHISGDWAQQDTERFSGLNEEYHIIQPGDHVFIPAPATTSPKFFIGLTPNNRTPEVGSKRDHDTAVEVTFKGFADFTYYDVDIEKGFSVPVWCHGQNADWDTGQGCTADVLAECPEVSKHHDEATGIYDQCRASDASNNFNMRGRLCPNTYVKYDDNKTKVIDGCHVVVCTILDSYTSSVRSKGHSRFRKRQLEQ